MARTPMLLLLRWLVAAACLAAHRADARGPRGANDDSTTEAIRATSNGFTIRIPCFKDRKCSGDLLQLKKVSESQWISQPLVQMETTVFNLSSNSEYDVEVSLGFNTSGIIQKKMKVWTCPEEVPKLTKMRVAKTGPGWLDVRWPPVRDRNCSSNIYYLARYGVDAMTEWMPVGVYNRSNGGEEVFRPTHPCAAWDGEFCLLLTDDVQPGRNHTVEVKPIRYTRSKWRGGGGDEGAVARLAGVVADANETGPYVLGARDPTSPCPPPRAGRGLATGGGGGGGVGSLHRPVTVPVWAIALAALALVVAVALFVAARCRHRTMNNKQLLQNEPSLSTSPPSESLGYRGSSVYDDCMSTVHMGHHSLPHHSPPSHHPEPLYERVKGLQSEKLQGLQALAAAAAAKVAGEAKPEPAAAAPSNHYVAMGGHSQLIYDDAQGLVRSPPQPTYCNLPAEARDSNPYVEPGSPVYDVATGADARASHHSTGYNRPYSHAKPGPWRAW